MEDNTEINLTLNVSNDQTTQKTTVVSSNISDVRNLLDKLAEPEMSVDLGFDNPMQPNDYMPYGDEVADMSNPVTPAVDMTEPDNRFSYEPETPDMEQGMDDMGIADELESHITGMDSIEPEMPVMDLTSNVDPELNFEPNDEILLEPEDEKFPIFDMAEGMVDRIKNAASDISSKLSGGGSKLKPFVKNTTPNQARSHTDPKALEYALQALAFVGNTDAVINIVSQKFGASAAESIKPQIEKMSKSDVNSYQRMHDSVQRGMYSGQTINEDWGSSDTSAAIESMRRSIGASGSATPNSIMMAAEEAAEAYNAHMGFDSVTKAADWLAAIYTERELPGMTDIIPHPKVSMDRIAMEGIADYTRQKIDQVSAAEHGITSGVFPVVFQQPGKSQSTKIWTMSGLNKALRSFGMLDDVSEVMASLRNGTTWSNAHNSIIISKKKAKRGDVEVMHDDIDLDEAEYDYRDTEVKDPRSYDRSRDLSDFGRQGHAKKNMKRGGKGDNTVPEADFVAESLLSEFEQFKKNINRVR